MTTIFEQLAVPPSQAVIDAKLEELRRWISRKLPAYDTQDPVLTSVWLSPLAERLAAASALTDAVADYGSLSLVILDGLTGADREAVRGELAKQLGLQTISGSFAVGEVQLRFTSNQNVVLPRGTLFTAGNLDFELKSAFVLRSKDSAIGSVSERLLREDSDSTWSASVPVTAVTAGTASNLSKGSTLSTRLSLPNLQAITAAGSFIGGREANSLQDLIDGFFQGFAAKTLGTRDQIVAYFQSRVDLGPIRQVGVIGFGDGEMLRDKHNFLPFGGGRADVYLASDQFPTTHTVNLSANVSHVEPGFERYVLGIERDVSPGYYRIVSIVDVQTGKSVSVDSEVRGFDNGSILDEQVPELSEAAHAGFSRFQTATVNLSTKDVTGSVVGDTRQLAVTFQRIPAISDAQTAVSNRNKRYVSGDTLVRAAIPLFLRIFIRLRSAFDTTLFEAEEMRQAVVGEVTRRPMRPAFRQSDFVRVIDRYLSSDLSVQSIEFSGTLIRPDGQVTHLTGKDEFLLPVWPTDQITPRTIATYISVADVKISVARQVGYETP